MMKRLAKSVAMLLTAALMVGLLAGCSSAPAAPAAPATPAPKPADNGPIRVAVLAPFSGNFTQYGEGYKAAIEMKLKEYNDAGGYKGRKVVAEYFDDKCDAKEGVTAAQKIVNDNGILITLGPWSSTVGFAVGPMFGKAKMGLYGISTSHMDFVKQNEYIIRQTPRIDQFQIANARLAWEEFGAKTAAFLHYKDDTGTQSAQLFKDAFEKLGGKMVGTETFMTGAVDFSAQLTKLIAAKPATIQTFGSYSDTAKIIQQAKKLDYKGLIGLGGSAYNQGLIDIAGAQAEGSIAIVHVDPNQPQAVQLFGKFKQASGKEMDAHSYMAYDAIWHVLQGIDAVGPDREKLVKYLRNDKNAKGTFGTVQYTDGEPSAPVFPVVVKGGKFTTLPLTKTTLQKLAEPIK